MSDAENASPDGGETLRAHTIRLELIDEPGELLAALGPIADNGGNLLSVFHERGSLTPRGHIPVEIDFECPPDRFSTIVDALRDSRVNVIQAGTERYGESLTLLLVGDLVETDLSDTLSRLERCSSATLTDFELSATEGMEDTSSARLRLAVEAGHAEAALGVARDLADEKGLHLIPPLATRGVDA